MAALLMSGCKSAPTSTARSNLGAVGAPAAAMPAPARDLTLPQADPRVPFEQYARIDRGDQVACLYYAVAALPVDYEKMARIVSEEYRAANDEFRKRELMAALKPRVDGMIDEFHRNRYVHASLSGVSLEHYDFKTTSFPVNSPWRDEGSYIYFGGNVGYTIAFTNGQRFHSLPMADEAAARALEARVAHYDNVQTGEVYFFAQGADMNGDRVKCQIVKVALRDRRANVVAELRPEE